MRRLGSGCRRIGSLRSGSVPVSRIGTSSGPSKRLGAARTNAMAMLRAFNASRAWRRTSPGTAAGQVGRSGGQEPVCRRRSVLAWRPAIPDGPSCLQKSAAAAGGARLIAGQNLIDGFHVSLAVRRANRLARCATEPLPAAAARGRRADRRRAPDGHPGMPRWRLDAAIASLPAATACQT